jgi:anti-sigma B factor antagonist
MSELGITIHIEQANEDTASVVLGGRFDARNAQTVKETLQQLVEEGTNQLIVDLAQVPFIDSAGLAALVSALKATRREGGSVLLSGIQPQARTVFSLTMLDQVFTIHATLDEALNSLESR